MSQVQPPPPPRRSPVPAYGKLPPQALDKEEAVLGAIMLEKDKLAAVTRIMKSPDCFYADANQKIYGAIIDMGAKGIPIDYLTVTEALRKAGQLESIGGVHYLTQLTFSVTNTANVEAHALIVLQKFFAREIIRLASDAMSKAFADEMDIFEQLDQVQARFASINDHIRTGNIKSFGASLVKAMQEIESASQRIGDGLLGLPTGLSKLDCITDGLTAPDFIVVAGGTGEGKTTFALNMAESQGLQGIPSGFMSLEMKDRQLIWKVLSSHIRENIKSIRKGNFSKDKWDQLTGGVLKKLYNLPVYIYDQGGLNIVELKAIARTMVSKYGIQILYIDYLQLVRGAGKRFGTREEEVNFVSKELKALAMELEIPIIALSQLNRIEKQNAKRLYRLSDLRESGAIEQDADGVIFIYRPTEHEQNEMAISGESMHFTETDALIEIAKWRLGETGIFRARFDGAFNKFSDYDPLPQHDRLFIPGGFEPGYTQGLSAAGRAQIRDFSQPLSQQTDADDTPF